MLSTMRKRIPDLRFQRLPLSCGEVHMTLGLPRCCDPTHVDTSEVAQVNRIESKI
jgi:hypothetical protein